MTMLANLEETPATQPPFTFGTISCGADTWKGAFGKGRLVFSMDARLRSNDPRHRSNYHRTVWSKYPNLDLLIVNNLDIPKSKHYWETDWGTPTRARNILVFHSEKILTAYEGKWFKSWCSDMKIRGYKIHSWQIQATECGASIWSSYFVTFCYSGSYHPDLPLQLGTPGAKRACRNLIRTYGDQGRYRAISSMTKTSSLLHSNLVGTLSGQPVYDWDGPFSSSGNSWVLIPDMGIRHLKLDELEKLKGLDNSQYTNLTPTILLHSIEQHVWACIGEAITPYVLPPTAPLQSKEVQPIVTPPCLPKPPILSTWKWSVPDLQIGSSFYYKSLQKLTSVVKELGLDASFWIHQGLETLAAHRRNYGENGPQHLVVLWWEWPQVHWEDLRLGVSMNFMDIPVPGIMENQDLEGEALEVAIKFVDELISLKVLSSPSPSITVVNTFPLFLVIKAAQVGQFRTIADGKQGGQNDVCIADPCHMTSPDHILPYLYTGGFSGTLDLSKFFHMFLTRQDEHQYMGLVHPKTSKLYVYNRLPMGTRNSPGASGRFGAAFIRMIIESSPLFQGRPIDNSIQQYFTKCIHHPTLGEGRVLIGSDGLPVVLIWLHVDDIFIHAPTLSKLEAAMDHIMDLTVRLGLICHPSKTSPPSQRVTYCGFEYDTTSTPTLHIPLPKVSRAVAMINFLRSGVKRSFSRLLISMVVGFLQSLVPATPGNIGAAFLRPVYEDLHQLATSPMPNTRKAYFCSMELSPKSQLCLQWWIQALSCGLSKQIRPKDIATLGVTWGDGSGTGAGGTFNLASSLLVTEVTTLNIWQGVWSPLVSSFSSNWKELMTLKQTLSNAKQSQVMGRRLLYFTDNMVSYDIFRKGNSKSLRLWQLLLDIKILELRLGCIVQVIHVPGTIMISQGTDGLSRGVTMQRLASHQSNSLIPLMWRSAPVSPPLLDWILSVLPPLWSPSTQWLVHTDFTDWSRNAILGQCVFWSVSPSFARQAILQALSVWVETPTACGHIFLVPRLLQRDYGRLSKFVVYCGQFTDLPLPFTPLVPFVVFFIPPFDRRAIYQHQRQQLHDHMDTPPDPVPLWIKKEILDMQRLSTPC